MNSRNKMNSILFFSLNKGTLISNSRTLKKVMYCHLVNHFSPIHLLRIFNLDFLLSSVLLVQCSLLPNQCIMSQQSLITLGCVCGGLFGLVLTGIKKKVPVQLSESMFQCDWAAFFKVRIRALRVAG